MSRAEDYLQAVHVATHEHITGEMQTEVEALLAAVAEAWLRAEATPISENEAQRWSRVCSAAEAVVGL